MPTDTLQSLARSRARSFVAAAVAYSVIVFGLLKLGWVETHVVLPLTQWQGRMAAVTIGAPSLPVDVTLACSGADAFALCAGAILAYPAAWRRRLAGTAIGFGVIVLLNSIRIGTLGRVASSPSLFDILHVYVWPAILVLAIAGYVFGWMQWVNTRLPRSANSLLPIVTPGAPARAFAMWATALLLFFIAASPIYLQSHAVLVAAAGIARAAAGLLRVTGMDATASANVLWTSKGGFAVTQECVATPLMPLYCAAVMTFVTRWRWRLPGLAAAVPIFIVLGIARLLVVALPAAVIGSPLFLIHAFYQIVLAALVVGAVAAWRRGATAWRVSVVACVGGLLVAVFVTPVYAAVPWALSLAVPFDDAQGAMATLPSFQAGLFVALSIAAMPRFAWRAFSRGAGALLVMQAAAFTGLHLLSAISQLTPQIRDVRAWAIAAPLAIVVIGVIAHDRPRA